jgi:ABC-2 type transport system permease protein
VADRFAGKHSKIQINVDATAMFQAGNGAVLLQSIIGREVRNYISRSSSAVPPNIGIMTRAKYNPNLDAVWFTSIVQMINTITILSIILSGAAVIREREQGTIENLLVMSVTSLELTLSKVLVNGFVIILAALLSLLFVVRLFLGVPLQGSLGWFVVGAVQYQFSVMAFGSLLATLTSSMAQFGLLVVPILMSMLLLSGSITPLESMPEWMQFAMQFVPSTQFVSFAQATPYRAAGFDTIWHHLMIIAATWGAFFTLSVFRLHRWVAIA